MTTNTPRAPAGLGPAGRGLWNELTEEFEPDPAEAILVEQACRVVDLIAELDDQVRRDGPTLEVESKHVKRKVPHPAMIEARQQRMTLARIIAALRIPDAETDQRPQRRATRGVYATGGGTAAMNQRRTSGKLRPVKP